MNKKVWLVTIVLNLVLLPIYAEIIELPPMQVVSTITRTDRPISTLPMRAELIAEDIGRVSATSNSPRGSWLGYPICTLRESGCTF